MAASKTPKAELIAIYRLEFYKKQKNWKLSEDTRKEKEAQKCLANNKVLNRTYSIEDNDDDQHALNDAFLVDEPGKEAPTSTTTLRTQLLEPISACQECQKINKPQTPWADCVNDVLPLEKDLGTGYYGNVDKCSGDNEFEGFDAANIGGMVWTNSGYPQNWIGDMKAQVDMIQETVCPEPIQWPPDYVNQLTPWPDDHMWPPEIWGEDKLQKLEQSLEDIEDFLIGAHSAPHSSEIELCVPDEADVQSDVSMCSVHVSRMSPSQLAAAARRHALSLSALLREGRRRRFRSTLSLDTCAVNHFELTPRDVFSTDFSYEAFPTRDTGFNPQPLDGRHALGLDELRCNYLNRQGLNPGSYQLRRRLDDTVGIDLHRRDLDRVGGTQMNLQFSDGFVAGSFRNSLQVDFVGRGRGRLLADDAVGLNLTKPGI